MSTTLLLKFSIHSGSRQGKQIFSFTKPLHRCLQGRILVQHLGSSAIQSFESQQSLCASIYVLYAFLISLLQNRHFLAIKLFSFSMHVMPT